MIVSAGINRLKHWLHKLNSGNARGTNQVVDICGGGGCIVQVGSQRFNYLEIGIKLINASSRLLAGVKGVWTRPE